MLVVISPSKTQDFSNNNIKEITSLRQTNETFELIDILRDKNINDIKSLMKISDNLSKLNYERFQSFELEFNATNSSQAIIAFKGDVYSGIDAESMNTNDLDFLQGKLRILSGLYGVVRPLDLIQPYRLEMGTKLENNVGANLYKFWGGKISSVLNEDESEVIINLASNEYFKGIDKKSLTADIINIFFRDEKDGIYKIVGIYAKKARGKMVRYIVDNRIEDSERIKEFDIDGYKYNEEMSDEKNWHFLR